MLHGVAPDIPGAVWDLDAPLTNGGAPDGGRATNGGGPDGTPARTGICRHGSPEDTAAEVARGSPEDVARSAGQETGCASRAGVKSDGADLQVDAAGAILRTLKLHWVVLLCPSVRRFHESCRRRARPRAWRRAASSSVRSGLATLRLGSPFTDHHALALVSSVLWVTWQCKPLAKLP